MPARLLLCGAQILSEGPSNILTTTVSPFLGESPSFLLVYSVTKTAPNDPCPITSCPPRSVHLHVNCEDLRNDRFFFSWK